MQMRALKMVRNGMRAPQRMVMAAVHWVTPRSVVTCAAGMQHPVVSPVSGLSLRVAELHLYLCAAGGGVVVAQSMYLLSVYVPMPAPPGDTFGLERWHGAAAAAAAAQRSLSPLPHDHADAPAHRPGESGDGRSASGAASARALRQRRNVLIIGDSLVVGIGCKDMLVLPQSLCRQISDLLQVDISWRAVGVNGGDVRTIHKEVLETVKRFQLDRETSYREYLANLEAAALATSGRASGAAPTDAVLALASSRENSQQLLHHHLQQTPPHLRGAGAALFDFVRTHYQLKLAELGRGRGGGHPDSSGSQGDMAFSAGAMHSEPSPRGVCFVCVRGRDNLF